MSKRQIMKIDENNAKTGRRTYSPHRDTFVRSTDYHLHKYCTHSKMSESGSYSDSYYDSYSSESSDGLIDQQIELMKTKIQELQK